ncbi:uncharacterized protein LOC111434084 [Cucurbita moschata]|uniref:Uncharacterized protein LOC111434084 n=1 Tax=Cucurbita moschata TaxID=3662 RepID=A0A6J1EH73_CUCMO|nr:uncharacterized protein LOC111434084 [Cucurbita moschata]
MSSHSNLVSVDNPFMPYKPKPKPNTCNKYTNDYILAFFSSLLLLLSFCIIFKNLSFSSLFNSTMFWFFISNALIFIIAADYAYFSLSQYKRSHLYEHYSPPNPKMTHFQHQTSSFVVFDEKREYPDGNLQNFVPERCDSLPPLKTTPVRTYRRSKSEKPKRSVSKESKKKMAKRSESGKYEEKELEENEYSKMTDEELNRRVEEFIQRFNTQMRLETKSAELMSHEKGHLALI